MSDEPVVAPEELANKPTLPGQTEIVVGSPEHEALLKANPNASSYGPDVNIVQPPEPVVEDEGEPVEPEVPPKDEP
jgi:hypothetical protein